MDSYYKWNMDSYLLYYPVNNEYHEQKGKKNNAKLNTLY